MSLSLNDFASEVGIDKWIDAIGITNAPIPRAGVRTALQFFQRRMPRIKLDDALSFCVAMDFSKEVKEVLLQPKERVIAFRLPSEAEFKLFYTRPGRSKHSSGINPADRRAVHYTVVSPAYALESYTAPASDTWTKRLPGQTAYVNPRSNSIGYLAAGGGLQLLIPDAYRYLQVKSI